MTTTSTTAPDNERIGKGDYFYHYLKSDKYFFGGFFNLANNNLKATFNDFEQRLRLKNPKLENIGDILQMIDKHFPDDLSLSDYERRTDMLADYLPIVHKLRKINADTGAPDRNYFRTHLKMLIKTVDDLRNFYTHYYHKEIVLDERLFEFLDEVLLNTCLDVKKKRMKTDTNKAFLKKRFEALFEGKNPSKVNQEFNKAFYQLLYENKKIGSVSLAYRYQSIINDVNKSQKENFGENDIIPNLQLSSSGLLFLLSFFLRRKEQEQLLSKMEGFKRQDELRFIASRWVFTHKCFKGLKRTIKSSFDKETLLMQMIDELSKCPDVLYKCLSDKDKQEFVEDINEYFQEMSDENEEEKEVSHLVIRKRYEDKFAYFALRFLDEFAEFPSLRFQTVVGNYLQSEKEKEINLGTTILKTNRQIKERIKLFGKLSELSNAKAEYFKPVLEDRTLSTADAGLDPKWEIFPNPSYAFKGNNIPIYLDLKGFENKVGELDKEERDIEKRTPKSTIINTIFSEVKNCKDGQPTAYLSLNELPALLHEFLVNRKSGEEIEQIIFDKIKEQVANIKAADTNNKNIPSKLRKAKKEKDYNLKKLEHDIEEQIDECNEKIRLIKNCREYSKAEKTKFVFTLKQLGDEATWLADDIKRFMLPEARENWKAYEHSEFQRLLAFYKRFRNDALLLLQNKWQMNDAFGEMIKRCFNQEEFDVFYEKYLNNKIGLLVNYQNQIIEKKINLPDVFRYFNKRLYLIDTAENQSKELLKHPINFPRGIFDDKPTFFEKKDFATNKSEYAAWFVHSTKTKDEIQKYYKLNWAIRNNEALDFKTLSDKKKIRLTKDTQAAINKQVRKDVFTKAMADYIFEKTFDKQYEIPLNEVYQTKAEKEAMKIEALQQKYNETFIWNKVITIEILDGKIKGAVRLKDIGKFRALAQNPMVAKLVAYAGDEDWDKPSIEKELDDYKKIRAENLLKSVQQIEKKVLEKFQSGVNHPEILEHRGYPQFRKYIVQGFLKDKLNEDELNFINKNIDISKFKLNEVKQQTKLVQQAFYLILIRNKFAHNELPDVEFYRAMSNLAGIENRNSDFAEQLNQIFDTFKAILMN